MEHMVLNLYFLNNKNKKTNLDGWIWCCLIFAVTYQHLERNLEGRINLCVIISIAVPFKNHNVLHKPDVPI